MADEQTQNPPSSPSPTNAPAPQVERRYRFPPWVYLVVSEILGLLPLGVWAIGGAEFIKAGFQDIYNGVSVINPFVLIPIYFGNVASCDEYTCSALRFLNPLRYLGALFPTAWTVLNFSDGLSLIFIGTAFYLGFKLSLEGIKRYFDLTETKLGVAVGAALLTPFIASLIALVMQAAAMLLSVLIIYLISATLLAVRLIAKGWEHYKKAKEINERAETLAEMHEKAAELIDKARGV